VLPSHKRWRGVGCSWCVAYLCLVRPGPLLQGRIAERVDRGPGGGDEVSGEGGAAAARPVERRPELVLGGGSIVTRGLGVQQQHAQQVKRGEELRHRPRAQLAHQSVVRRRKAGRVVPARRLERLHNGLHTRNDHRRLKLRRGVWIIQKASDL
jgi:hypothetical protein